MGGVALLPLVHTWGQCKCKQRPVGVAVGLPGRAGWTWRYVRGHVFLATLPVTCGYACWMCVCAVCSLVVTSAKPSSPQQRWRGTHGTPVQSASRRRSRLHYSDKPPSKME